MKFTFDKGSGSIVVMAQIWGFRGATTFSLILDTGAESTVVNSLPLRTAGFDTSNSTKRLRLLTGSGPQLASALTVPKFKALGLMRKNFEIAFYELPKLIQCDGVLGLDFLRDHELNLNFRTGHIHLK